MIQLKPYQIRNIAYVLAFDLFRNQVKRQLVVKGKRTGEKLSQCVVFQTLLLPCPYGQWRQGGAGEPLKADWHSWAFHVGKYCWVSEGLATELPVKKKVYDEMAHAKRARQLQWKLKKVFLPWGSKIFIGINQFKQINLNNSFQFQ